MDVWSIEKRSEVMALIRSTGTTPELRLEAIVRSALPRYKIVLHDRTLPGKPDLAVPSLKLVLFMDGCFWHGCPIHGRVPSTRLDYWEPKLARTQQRDRRNARLLRAAGWSVWRVWEHALTGGRLDHTTITLTTRLRGRRSRMRAARSG